MSTASRYAVRCTLTFGDIYVQVLAWMAVISSAWPQDWG